MFLGFLKKKNQEKIAEVLSGYEKEIKEADPFFPITEAMEISQVKSYMRKVDIIYNDKRSYHENMLHAMKTLQNRAENFSEWKDLLQRVERNLRGSKSKLWRFYVMRKEKFVDMHNKYQRERSKVKALEKRLKEMEHYYESQNEH